jgi:hypothetical protein
VIPSLKSVARSAFSVINHMAGVALRHLEAISKWQAANSFALFVRLLDTNNLVLTTRGRD